MELNQDHIDVLDKAEAWMFHSDFCPYLELKELLADTSELARRRFQSLFTNYYSLNAARLSEDYKDRFFNFLFAGKGIVNGQADFQTIFREIGTFERKNHVFTTQFSFVSKLAGIHCESSPIFDQRVCTFFGGKTLAPSKDPAERIGEFIDFLKDVASNYQKWADDERVRPILQRFKAHDARLGQCHVIRLMDFLVWKSGEVSL